jgi:hypothetical protein
MHLETNISIPPMDIPRHVVSQKSCESLEISIWNEKKDKKDENHNILKKSNDKFLYWEKYNAF